MVGSLPDADAGCITDGVSLFTRYLPWWPGDLACRPVGLCHRASLAQAVVAANSARRQLLTIPLMCLLDEAGPDDC